jgi:ribosomal protein S12 methylthiotransferase accessory factor
MQIIQHIDANPANGMVEHIDLEVELPQDFPEKYRASLIRAAELCAVKKHLEHPPQITISARAVESVA